MSKWLQMSYKKARRSVPFTVRLPVRCVEIIDQLIEAGVYSSRGECIRDIVRSALREGFHRKMLPERSMNIPIGIDNNTRVRLAVNKISPH